MNSQDYKEKFGVSKTAYKNMKKAQLLGDNPSKKEVVVAQSNYATLRKARQAKVRRKQVRDHEDSVLFRRHNGKPRKRKDGKVRGSVKSRGSQSAAV